ncbi:MAG: hypothetical protein DUD26_06225 [Eubacteriaceae bacterium]|uniref:Uncharacterized protein n=1 Tax=Candidatus Pseudoramibacter fermentans TaxID=2594427 RepID=A0A6L5GQ42_9FIRM|nr:hypothetical protein [Candidatus Pseudoramibacter fermentans]RRF92579.1 MAG: hypothetical protein DUD26_06225 [Eubacteriaceae bacterium]
MPLRGISGAGAPRGNPKLNAKQQLISYKLAMNGDLRGFKLETNGDLRERPVLWAFQHHTPNAFHLR